MQLTEQVSQSISPNYYKFQLGGNWYDIDEVIAALGLNFRAGSAMKYIARHGKKGCAMMDLNKAVECLNREVNFIKEQKEKSTNAKS